MFSRRQAGLPSCTSSPSTATPLTLDLLLLLQVALCLMDSGPAPILPLTVQTVSLLRASQLLPSLPATLLYLLRHLLDLAPAASQLSLTLDPARWAVTIQLDGQGLETAAYNQLAAGEGIGLVGRVSLLELEGRDRTTGALRTTIVKVRPRAAPTTASRSS